MPCNASLWYNDGKGQTGGSQEIRLRQVMKPAAWGRGSDKPRSALIHSPLTRTTRAAATARTLAKHQSTFVALLHFRW